MTPEEKAKAQAAMLAYIQTHAKQLARAIVEDIEEGSWEIDIHHAAVESLIGHLPEEEYEVSIQPTLETVAPLLGFRAMFQFHIGDHCEYIIVERNLNHVS